MLVGSRGRRGDESGRGSGRNDTREKASTCKGDGLVDGLDRAERRRIRAKRVHTSTSVASASTTATSLALWRVMKRVAEGEMSETRDQGRGHTLQNGLGAEGTDCDGGEEGGEEEKVLWTDNDLSEV